MTAFPLRRVPATRALGIAGLGVLLGLAAGVSATEADEIQDDTVTITVTIDAFDPCVVGAPGCPDGEGGLAFTGATIGASLGAGALLTAVGVGIYAIARQRRAAGSD